ncbi:MAG: hypothetical protein CMF60_00880 [Magnetococcales bacterium]|nr:hypothetical protein [Magnetococcales bacterium]|tara:strand:+ start:8518 stop:8913 length:396 start_codon:yes stop_codon:yes gene_type:complete
MPKYQLAVEVKSFNVTLGRMIKDEEMSFDLTIGLENRSDVLLTDDGNCDKRMYVGEIKSLVHLNVAALRKKSFKKFMQCFLPSAEKLYGYHKIISLTLTEVVEDASLPKADCVITIPPAPKPQCTIKVHKP